MDADLDRRAFLRRSAGTGVAALTGGLAGPSGLTAAVAAKHKVTPLPSPAQVRADFQRMVDFGPRYTGTASHNRFIDWLERELIAAGVVMYPREEWPLTIWEAGDYGLELLDGAAKGPVKVSGYHPRTQETGPEGVTGELVYAGVAPVPALNTGPEGLSAAIAAYPAQVASWAQGLSGTLGDLSGAIVLVDLPLPVPLALGALVGPLATYLQWDGHTVADWLTGDFKRAALLPALNAPPPSLFGSLGAAGVVFCLDASAPAIEGGYMPFNTDFHDTPALWVDRDTGTLLRSAASQRPSARLTLTATRRKGASPSLLGYLPGTAGNDEALILNTHTDGEGFVEENGGVALVHLARHFGSLGRADALKRSLVFTLWPGHMAVGMPQLDGIIEKHGDIMRSAVAAITVEHLGATEWLDTADRGYHATGDPETMFAWTTQGPMFDLAREATIASKLPRTALMRPPAQFGVGGAFQSNGIPQVGLIAGPYYLVNDARSSDMEKLDEQLAARQVAWVADMLRRLDDADAAALMTGDPTLGQRSAGNRATFPPRPKPSMRLVVTTRRSRLRHGGKLRGAVTLNRSGYVRIHASVQHHRGGRRVSTGLADRLIHVEPDRAVSFALPTSGAGRAALRSRDAKVIVTARYREPGGPTTTSVVTYGI
ncbi:MAG: hypothetical protein QOH62_1660 [Solirubrobacteraceae bacterium]|nr:hypothetical protein [Solirubrobacteraceae bacterium]